LWLRCSKMCKLSVTFWYPLKTKADPHHLLIRHLGIRCGLGDLRGSSEQLKAVSCWLQSLRPLGWLGLGVTVRCFVSNHWIAKDWASGILEQSHGKTRRKMDLTSSHKIRWKKSGFLWFCPNIGYPASSVDSIDLFSRQNNHWQGEPRSRHAASSPGTTWWQLVQGWFHPRKGGSNQH
jgi:hypothetical protein